MRAYSIQSAPRLTYDITIKFAIPEVESEYVVSEINLSDRERTSNNDLAYATLIGDLQTPSSPPSLANKILLVPKDSNMNISIDDKSFHLLVERENVSFDGNTCNRIGTSYQAF